MERSLKEEGYDAAADEVLMLKQRLTNSLLTDMDKHKDEFNKHVEQHKQDIVATTNQCIELVHKAKIKDDEASYSVAIKGIALLSFHNLQIYKI